MHLKWNFDCKKQEIWDDIGGSDSDAAGDSIFWNVTQYRDTFKIFRTTAQLHSYVPEDMYVQEMWVCVLIFSSVL